MAFNLLGTLANIGRVLPGYMQGYRMATQDNWNDFQQYNQAQAGQIRNAFDEATFNPKVRMVDYDAMNREFGTFHNAMQTALEGERFPYMLQQNEIMSQFLPYLAGASGLSQMNMYRNQMAMTPQMQAMMMAGYHGLLPNMMNFGQTAINTPSGIGVAR